MLARRKVLDQLMGPDRNLSAEEKRVRDDVVTRWDDPSVCSLFLCGFCPYELFANTKSSLGTCHKRHEVYFRNKFDKEPESVKRPVLMRFLQMLERLAGQVDRRIERGHTRLSRSVANDASNPEFHQRRQKAAAINARIAPKLDDIQRLGEEGQVDAACTLVFEVLKLEADKEAVWAAESEQHAELDRSEKQLEVCDVCGALLVQNDAEQRVVSHLLGRQHVGYIRIRETLAVLRPRLQS